MPFKFQSARKFAGSLSFRYSLIAVVWLILISTLHYQLNFNHENRTVVRMGYMPVITNLSAPILDFVSRDNRDINLEALKFASFADMAEAFKQDEIEAAFIIAPLAIVLYSQGITCKIVYIGNRNESSLVVQKMSNINSISDLKGKTIAVPIRYSGHNLFLLNEISKLNMKREDFNIVEMQPPDMAAALQTGDIDAYCVGEPFAAQTLYHNESRLICHLEDKWPGFICNLVVLKTSFIENEKDISKSFIQALAKAGFWAEKNRIEAINIATKYLLLTMFMWNLK